MLSLKIALILSVLLQFATAFIALSLVKRTRTNVAWWLISLGFFLMAIRRLIELLQVYEMEYSLANNLVSSWIGVAISVLMLLSLSFIKRIFNVQKKYEALKEKSEAHLLSAVMRAEEKQREKFARELHDGLGPLLSMVKMSLSSLAYNPSGPQSKKVLQNSEKLIDDSISTVKELSNKLNPHIIKSFGVHKAILSFANMLNLDEKISFKYTNTTNNKRFPLEKEVAVYRIICELITNTLKHAEANCIFLDISTSDHNLHIKYMDDGKGFDYDSVMREKKGWGLTNILSRIKSERGKWYIHTKPGTGFNMEIIINYAA